MAVNDTTTQTLTHPSARARHGRSKTSPNARRYRRDPAAVVSLRGRRGDGLPARPGSHAKSSNRRCAPTSSTRCTRCGWPPGRLRATLRSFGQVIPPRRTREQLAGELQVARPACSARPATARCSPGTCRTSLRTDPGRAADRPGPGPRAGPLRAPPRRRPRRSCSRPSTRPAMPRLLAELDQLTAGPPRGPQAADPGRARSCRPPVAAGLPAGAISGCAAPGTHQPGHDRDVALHQARKSARRARYAGRGRRPRRSGKQARRFAKQMKKVQSVLGDHQDAVLGPPGRPGPRASARTWPARTRSPTASCTSTNATAPSACKREPERSWRHASRPSTAAG